MSKLVHDRYEAQVREGRLDRDAAQEAIVHKLDDLRVKLRGYRRPKKAGALGWLLGAKPSGPIKGLYIWGSVGRGKTMLMDFSFRKPRFLIRNASIFMPSWRMFMPACMNGGS